MTWEIHTADLCTLSSLLMRGRIRELGVATRERLATARQCGDLYGVTNLRTLYMPLVLLGEGDEQGAVAEVADGLAEWTGQGFDLQNLFALQVGCEIDVYRGNAYQAHLRRKAMSGKVARSLLLFVQLMRGNWLRLGANAALAAAYEEPKRARKLLRAANRFARKLERERSPWLSSLGTLARGLVAAARHDDDAASQLLSQAIEKCDEWALDVHAAIARIRLGELLAGDEGAELVSDGTGRLVDLGYHSPLGAAWMQGPCPRFGDSRWSSDD